MNVLSLFGGAECGKVALDCAGVTINNYYSSEIDSHAIKVAMKNHPDISHMGDITDWRNWGIDWWDIDLVIAGSPCQGFSKAGKGLAFDDPRSILYFVFERILKHVGGMRRILGKPPVKFMLENVQMSHENRNVITDRIGVSPVFINSNVISPCSRPRYYWANFEIKNPHPVDSYFLDYIDQSSTDLTLTDGWHKWWDRNRAKQLSKQFSKIPTPKEKGVCLLTRMYANWTGNFIITPKGKVRKPSKSELSALMGLPRDYFDCTSQRQAEIMTGNGWEVRTLTHIFRCMLDDSQ